MSAHPDAPPYRLAGALLLVVLVVAGTLLFLQFRGDLSRTDELTLRSQRSGLGVEPGAKVTYNGVEIGRVRQVAAAEGGAVAQLTLEVDRRYLPVIPANVTADIRATTVFGNKYIALASPEYPVAQRISRSDVITADTVTTEFNTLFETVTGIAEQVDPVKLNMTLGAAAEAMRGLGERFGESLNEGAAILDDLNPRMPRVREDVTLLTELADIYADASPELWDGLAAAVSTARTLDGQRDDIDAALIAALGFADDATGTLRRTGPYLARGAADLVPTSSLFDEYRGMIFCTARNYYDVAPAISRSFGGNGYSLSGAGTATGAGNPFIYPDNLPRINASGGPEGRPGCWQKITHELYPVPYLVMDTGYSLAPYNHIELGQPMLIDYVWGRQIGQLTINP